MGTYTPSEVRAIEVKDVKPEQQEARAEQRRRNQAAIELLRSWCDAEGADAQEQRETGEFLMKALAESRGVSIAESLDEGGHRDDEDE